MSIYCHKWQRRNTKCRNVRVKLKLESESGEVDRKSDKSDNERELCPYGTSNSNAGGVEFTPKMDK